MKRMKMFKLLTSAAIATVLTGCLIPEPTRTVMVMGDSIMQQQVANFGVQLQARDNAPLLFNNAMGGSGAAYEGQGVYWAGRIRASRDRAYDLDIIFVSLGTNDGTVYGDNVSELLIDFPIAIDTIMAETVGVEVYWQLPSKESAAPNSKSIRDMLFAAEEVYDNLTMVETDDGLLANDMVHLSRRGEGVMTLKFLNILGYNLLGAVVEEEVVEEEVVDLTSHPESL